MKPHQTRGVIVFVCIIIVALSADPGGAQTDKPTQEASVIDGPLLNALLDISKTRLSGGMFGGVSKGVDGHPAVFVTSNRAVIARSNAAAIEKGARYTPPAETRVDLVAVLCGNGQRFSEIFNCTKVSVLTGDGSPIRPLLYTAQEEAFRSAFGVKWTAKIVTATYRAVDLREGFKVNFASDDGTEWTLDVSKTSADGNLFLAIDPTTGETSRCASRGVCVP